MNGRQLYKLRCKEQMKEYQQHDAIKERQWQTCVRVDMEGADEGVQQHNAIKTDFKNDQW